MLLTTGTDTLSPNATVAANKTTSGNDTINATGATFTALDNIDAGAGNDKIIIKDAAGVMNTVVPSGVTLTSVESMEIQTSGSLGVAEVSPVTALSAVKEIDTWNFPAATLSSVTTAYTGTATNNDTIVIDGDGVGGGTTGSTLTYVAASGKWADATSTQYDSLALAVKAAIEAELTTLSATGSVFVGTDGLVYTNANISAFTFTAGGGNTGVVSATAGTDADALVPGGKFSVAYGTSTLVTAALDATPTQAEAMTLIANAINAMAGSTVATVVGDYMTVSAPVAGTALPSYSVTYWANGTNTTANPSSYAVVKQDTVANQAARDAVTGVAGQAYDVSGFTDTTDVSVTTSNGMGLKAAATQNVTVSGGTGTIAVIGGKDVVVTDATAAKAITVGDNTVAGGDAAGKITITDTNNTGANTISAFGGTDVTITTTADKASSGAITVGHATNGQASGAVVVTQNTTNDATAAITAGNVTVTGGSTVNITANMTNTAVKAGTTGNNITAGTFTVTAGNTTTDVTVTQVATATDFANDASLGTKETAVITFGALKQGEAVLVGETGGSTAGTELTFTASKDLTAAEVAAAFANLTNADIQAAGGKVANGIFTGTLDAGWTSGAANGAAVTFTATTVGNKTNLDVRTDADGAGAADDGATDDAKFAVVVTDGTGAAASTLRDVTADYGNVVIDDNATASIKTVTLDGYDTATIGNTTALTALTTVSLSNSSGANIIDNGATATALTLNLNKITGTTDIDNGAASVTDLTVNTSGAASSTVLTAAELKNLTVSGSQLLTLTTSTLTKLDKVVVSGTAGLTIGGTNEVDTVTSVNTSATTGTTTIAIDGTKATYVGGAGVDVVTLATGTALTKSIDLGAGDDTLVFDAGVTGSSTTLSGGDGTDTLSMSVARADALDASAVSFYTNFERLTLNNANTAALTVDLANLGFTNYVTTSGTAGVVYTGAGTAASATEKFTFVYNGVEYTATLAGTDADAFNTAIDTAVITGTTTQLGVNKVTATLTNTGADLTIVADDAANTLTAGVYNDTSATATITGTDQALTLNKLAANATVVLTKDGAVTATLADATGSSDVVNVVANVAAANIDFGTFTAANVETINITANDTKADDNGDGTTTDAESAPEKATLILTADKATTVNVTGSAAVALTLTGSTKVATLDGSSMTGALTVTSVSTDAAIVMKGGSANDTLISAATSTKADELHGGAGNDSLTANKGMTKMYGGEGADTFNIVVASTNVNSAATIMDLGSGDVIKFAGADAFKSAAITLDTTAVFQDFANAAIASITSENDLAWFQFGGNTYIVQEKDEVAGGTYTDTNPDVFVNNVDFIVKIAGLVDLSTASFNATSGTLEIA